MNETAKVIKFSEFGRVAPGGKPPYDGGMELSERVVRVEEKLSGVDKRLELVEKDLRSLSSKVDSHFLVLAGMIIALGVGMAGLMAKGFHWF